MRGGQKPEGDPPSTGEVILYPTPGGSARVECRFSGETVWLTQALIAALFDKDVRTINEHIQNLSDNRANDGLVEVIVRLEADPHHDKRMTWRRAFSRRA